MIEGEGVALYARVSSDGQARDNTIAGQVAALREGVAADGFRLMPDHAYVDEGYSGTILLRPALERLRDALAAGIVTQIYIHAPDRLARRYAHQVLLIEEFHRAGADVVFLNHSIGGMAEDDLLLQVQGVIAEYERAKILERGRRGRRHAACCGSVSALTGAPFGYRYVRRDLGGGVARFEVVEEEACIVRLIFAWVGLERTSIREVCRRLERMGCRTRQGATRWYMRRRSAACSTIQPISVARSSVVFTTRRLAPGCGRSEDILDPRRVLPNASRLLARNGSISRLQLWSIRRCSKRFARNSKRTVSANEIGRLAPAGCFRV